MRKECRRAWKSATRPEASGVFALATRHGEDGAVGLVLANYGFAQRQRRTVGVRLANLAAGEWRLTRYRVDSDHSNRWDAEGDPFTAAAMIMGYLTGRWRDEDRFIGGTGLAHRLTHRLYARYKEHYGTVLCRDVRKGVHGDCPKAVGRAARWATEILIEEFGPA